jgi:hypothetical protein
MAKVVPVGLGTFLQIIKWLLIWIVFITALTVASIALEDNLKYELRKVEIYELVLNGNIIEHRPFTYEKRSYLYVPNTCPTKYYLVNANSLYVERIVEQQMGVPGYCFIYYSHYDGVLLIPKSR